MRSCLLAILIVLVSLPCIGMAQQSGSFIAGFELGITSATGEFRDSMQASTGFGIGAELRYTLFNGLSLGPFIRYNRFGTSIQSNDGSYSFNYVQYGGILHLNLVSVERGNLFIVGGGGMFTPKSHIWALDYSNDESFETGQFFTFGAGLTSNPKAPTIFELEARYNIGNADYKYTMLDEEHSDNYDFNSIVIVAKISFNSKGIKPGPRY
jgi:opacity protein-like surface antigen